MIAAHTSQDTVQHTPKTRKPPKFDPIAPHSGQSIRSTQQVPEAQNIGDAQPATRRRLYIARSIKRMIDSDLFGYTYVECYLNRLARCGCPDSTIKMNFSSLYLFISYLKSQDRSCLETTVRADISGFIEHEQDRGLAPTTISTQLESVIGRSIKARCTGNAVAAARPKALILSLSSFARSTSRRRECR